MTAPQTTSPEDTPPDVEHRFHRYVGSHIPWFVHLMWVLFWVFVIAYCLTYFLPALKTEIANPP